MKHQSSSNKTFSLKSLEGAVNYFHVTQNYLGEKFTLTPRIPNGYRDAYNVCIEDSTTPRVCLSSSIRKCFIALNMSAEARPRIFDSFVYGTKNDIDVLVPWGSHCPSSPGNPYGEDFDVKKYEKFVGRLSQKNTLKKLYYEDNTDMEFHKKLFVNCVPDANKTGEVWSLVPTEVILLGQIDDGKFYLAKWIVDKAVRRHETNPDTTYLPMSKNPKDWIS